MSNVASFVYLVYRGNELRAEEILKRRILDCNNIKVLYNSNVVSYLVNDNKFSGVLLDNGDRIGASCVFLAIGHVPDSELCVGKKNGGYIVVDEFEMTNIEGV